MSRETHFTATRDAIKPLLVVGVFLLSAAIVGAQSAQVPASNVTGRSINAIGYQVKGGSTMVDLKGTGLIPRVTGEAKVEAKPGITTVQVEVSNLTPPTSLGAEFLTYVLWSVSPDGRAINLGEVLFDNNGSGKLKATTQLQSFSLFVTAEPYFAVRQPSEMVILENEIRKDTKGKIFVVDNYQLMKRSQYQKMGNPLALSLDLKNVPLEMYEARNAVEIAKERGAEKYAPDIFAKADGGLKMAENALARKANRKEIVSLARQAAQSSEDARALTAERLDQERIAAERAAAAAAAKAKAEEKAAAEAAAAKRAADEEARRQAEIAAAKEAQLKSDAAAKEARLQEEARHQAELAAAREAAVKAEAAAKEARMQAESEVAAAKAKAEADALRAKEEAAKAETQRALQAAADLRAQLLDQLNRILETRDTPRGLVVTMADVLFDSGKYKLRPNTELQLAKLAGIVLAHSGLNLEVDGYTDSTGSDEFNQKLSEQRASTVREFLISQGLSPDAITSRGFGKDMPVASNDTPSGRQKNRRVELVISGQVIGQKVGD
ncbi:MAG TPA: OmpA family protein [Bryobacteraceae bacterium]|nr:OmpA family protein [Bryobacteraceae bacterium]